MSLWPAKPYLLGIGLREVVALERVRGNSARLVAVAPLDPTLSGGMPEVRNWMQPLGEVLGKLGKGAQVQVTLADDWVRYFNVTPPAGLGSLMELKALAQARFEELFGGSADTWLVEGDWHSEGGMLASGVSTALLDSLRAAAQAAGITLMAVEPALARWFNRYLQDLPADCWYCSFGERSVCAVLYADGQVQHARQYRFDVRPDAGEMVVRLESETMRQGFAMPTKVYYAGQAPDGPVVAATSGVTVYVLGRQASLPAARAGGSSATPEACQLAFAGAAL